MSQRSLLALLALLLVLAALALLVSTGEREAARPGLLLPELQNRLDDIDKIRIDTGGNTRVASLQRREGRWVVAERAGYPADLGRLRRLLLGLAEARVLETMTANPALHDRLGIEDPAEPGAAGIALALQAGERIVGQVVLGSSPAAGQFYARLLDEDQGFLITLDADLGRDTRDWLAPDLLNIPASRIASISISHPDGEALRLAKEGPGAFGFVLDTVPEGREPRAPRTADGIGGVLASLRLEDVARAEPPQEAPVVARFTTGDGLVLTAETWMVEDGRRVRLGAATEGDVTGEILQEAADINALTAGWLFTLPTFKSAQLVRQLEELLEPVD
ncbi:MAG: DUF4340 domain-containing protein [Chromatiales bacterium]|nr:DUF4340 domain-containing protein [Chromatiales bacterium]